MGWRAASGQAGAGRSGEQVYINASTGNLVVKVRPTPDSETQVYTVLSGIPLEQRFTYSIALSAKGTLTVSNNLITHSANNQFFFNGL